MRTWVSLVLGIALSILSVGCSASWVDKGSEPRPGGIVRYMPAEMEFLQRRRERDAETKMNEFCRGSYKVVMERDDGIEGNYRYITFRCL